MLHFRLHGGGARRLAPLWSLREGRRALLSNTVGFWQGRGFLLLFFHRDKIDVGSSATLCRRLSRRWRGSSVLSISGSLGKLLLLGLRKYSRRLVRREGRFVTRRARMAQGRSVRILYWLWLMRFVCVKLMLRPSVNTCRVMDIVMSLPSIVGICKFCVVSPGFIPRVLSVMVHRCRLTTGIG